MGHLWLNTVGVEASGAIDGVNTTYTLDQAYAPGTVRALPNGRMGLPGDHATPEIIETSPSTGVVDLTFALIPGDTLHFLFQDVYSDFPALTGIFPSPAALIGEFPEHSALEGVIAQPSPLIGEWPAPEALTGRLPKIAVLTGEWP